MLLTPSLRWGAFIAVAATIGLAVLIVGVREKSGVPWLRFQGWLRLPETVQTYTSFADDGVPIRVHYFGTDTLASVEYDLAAVGEYDCREDYESDRVVAVFRRRDSGWEIDAVTRSCR